MVKPEETLTEEEVIAHCKEKLAAYKVPRMVEFRQELPKSMVGKVLRKELRAEEYRTILRGRAHADR
jgi:long-chain acyl-CoA synthetase